MKIRTRKTDKISNDVESTDTVNTNDGSLSFKPKLPITEPGDKSEQEADMMSEKVMSTSRNVQRMPDTSYIQAKSSGNKIAGESISSQIDSTNGGGSSMDSRTKSFMESKFGANFSGVKIHTGDYAVQMSEELNAQAFTVGNDIYFNSGKYNTGSDKGKHLLAHELTHTMQQGNAIRRTPKDIFGRELGFFPTPQQEAFDAESARIGWDRKTALLEAELKLSAAYTGLPAVPKQRAERIITVIKTKPIGEGKGERYYYFRKLKEAITTPFIGTESGGESYGCSSEAETKNKDAVEKALKYEKENWNGLFADVEEKKVGKTTNKITRIGEQGKKFYVDRTDVKNIKVYMKVKLNGAPAEVSKIKQLEDAIEREVSLTTKGYTLDIEFVNVSGPDVFEFTVKFCQWANSGNWASGPVSLSHEVHHALGLHDRYDYIEAHSTNRMMNVAMRLVWFEEELKKTVPNNLNSKMGISSRPLLNDDVCTVAFEPGPARDSCIADRKAFNPAGSPP